jgi:hypothetical protein
MAVEELDLLQGSVFEKVILFHKRVFYLPLLMRSKIFLFFFLVAWQIGLAQNDSTKRKHIIGFYSQANTVYGDLAKINDVIMPLGYPELRDSYAGVSIGYSLRRSTRKSYINVGFSYLTSTRSGQTDLAATKDGALKNWEVHVRANYDLIKHPKWLIYPYLGEGLGYGEFTLYDNITRQSFATSVANFSGPTTKTWSSIYVYINTGMGIERKFRVWVYDFYVGVSGGYRLSTSNFFSGNYPPFYQSDRAPIKMSGFEWNFRLRFEIWDLKRLNRMDERWGQKNRK